MPTSIDIRKLLPTSHIALDLRATDCRTSLEELLQLFSDAELSAVRSDIMRLLLDREKTASTAIPNGIALPHVRIPGLKHLGVALGISKLGLPFQTSKNEKTHIVLLFLAPEHDEYLRSLGCFSQILSKPDIQNRLLDASTPEEVLDVLVKTQ